MTCQPRPVLSHRTASVLVIVVTSNLIGVSAPAVSAIGLWLLQTPPACAIVTGTPPIWRTTVAPPGSVVMAML